MFDPRTDIEQSSTIVLEQRKNEGMTWGANGNHAKIRWVGPPGQDMIVSRASRASPIAGSISKSLTLGRRVRAGTVRRVPEAPRAPGRRRGPLQIHLRDITSYGTYGIVLQGAVFEGMCENVHGENNIKDGMYMEHTNVGHGNQGIVSNIQLIHPNISGTSVRGENTHRIPAMRPSVPLFSTLKPASWLPEDCALALLTTARTPARPSMSFPATVTVPR